jgi:hypothetical protein
MSNYKYENMPEEDRNALIPAFKRVESTTDFKDRIRKLCGVEEGAGRKAHPCVVRNKRKLMILEDIDRVHVYDSGTDPDDLAFGRARPVASFGTYEDAEAFIKFRERITK